MLKFETLYYVKFVWIKAYLHHFYFIWEKVPFTENSDKSTNKIKNKEK